MFRADIRPWPAPFRTPMQCPGTPLPVREFERLAAAEALTATGARCGGGAIRRTVSCRRAALVNFHHARVRQPHNRRRGVFADIESFFHSLAGGDRRAFGNIAGFFADIFERTGRGFYLVVKIADRSVPPASQLVEEARSVGARWLWQLWGGGTWCGRRDRRGRRLHGAGGEWCLGVFGGRMSGGNN